MDNQNQNPVTPPATQNDLPVSEIVSALKSAPVTPVAPIVNPLQEVAAPPAPIAPTPPAPPAVNPLAEDPDQVTVPGDK